MSTATAITTALPAADTAAAWAPPADGWVVKAKDIMCTRMLVEHPEREPLRVGLPTVLSIIEGLGIMPRDVAEAWIRDRRSLATSHSRFVIAPEHREHANARTPGGA